MKSKVEATRLEPPTCDDKLIWDVWMSAYHFPALTVADELGLFDLLDQSALTVEEAAARLAINNRGAMALLGLLSSLGFIEQHEGKYHLAEVSRNYMLPDGAYYWGPMLKLYQDPALGHQTVLEALLRDRRIDRERSTAEWAGAEIGRERAKALTAGMHSHSLPAALGAARQEVFGGVQRLLDIGGGSGCFCIALAQRHPQMRFTVLELPAVCEFTSEYVAQAGLENRIKVVGGDMFRDDWPGDHDAILLSNILHDWDEARCFWLCRRAFKTLPPGGRIYIHTMLLAETKDRPLATAGFSMNMLVRTEGRQFAAQELAGLLRQSGFVDVSSTATYAYYSIVRARKPHDG